MRIEDKALIQWCDNQLKDIEKQADAIGYRHEEDGAYIEIVEQITAIEWEEITPTPMTWMTIGYMIGILRGRVNQKAMIG